jgi:hypothetical protein
MDALVHLDESGEKGKARRSKTKKCFSCDKVIAFSGDLPDSQVLLLR